MNNCSNLSEKNIRNDGYMHENTYNCYLNESSKFNDGKYSRRIEFWSLNQCLIDNDSELGAGLSENTFFTPNPDELVGARIHSRLVKSYKGLGFTIVGGDDNKQFLQIKSIVTNGPAWYEGKLQTGKRGKRRFVVRSAFRAIIVALFSTRQAMFWCT